MFPKFLVIAVKHQPATPTSAEQNQLLETRAVDDPSEVDAVTTYLLAKHRNDQVSANYFGPASVKVRVAVFVNRDADVAAELTAAASK